MCIERVMIMFKAAINYPFNSNHSVKTLTIGGILTLLSFLLIPAFLVSGYLLRVLRAVAADEELPAFDDWVDMGIEGVKVTIIFIAYALIPAVIFFLSGGLMFFAEEGISGIVGGMLGMFVAALVGLVLLYVAPVGIVRFAETGRMGSAFGFRSFWPTLTNAGYAVGWLLALGVIIAAGVITTIVNGIPLLGLIVAAFVNFYVSIVVWHLYGRAVTDATAETTSEHPVGRPTA
jgi:hypothetical protein